MSPEIWGSYCYSVAGKKTEISWGMLTSEVIQYLTAPPNRLFSIKATPDGDVVYMGDIPVGAASLETLVPLVDRAIVEMSRHPRHPGRIVFPGLKSGKSLEESAVELRLAAESLLLMLEAEKETLSILYSYALPKIGLWFAEPSWGGQMSGIRLPNDPHFYHLCSDLGRLELIRQDPADGKELGRIDIRSWDVIHTANTNPEMGDIQICRKKMDLEPFIGELGGLVQFLKDAVDKKITIERVDKPGAKSI
jgi:hypothetical protein